MIKTFGLFQNGHFTLYLKQDTDSSNQARSIFSAGSRPEPKPQSPDPPELWGSSDWSQGSPYLGNGLDQILRAESSTPELWDSADLRPSFIA